MPSRVYYYQSYPIVAPVTIRSNYPFQESETYNLKIQRTTFGSQRWELEFNVNFDSKDFRAADYFTEGVTSYVGLHTMPMPQFHGIDEFVNHTFPLACRANPVGSSSIDFTAIGPAQSTTTRIRKGTFIQFSNHSKVYLLTSDIMNNDTSFDIFPTLRVALTTAHSVYHPGSRTIPQITSYRSRDTLNGISFSDGIMVDPGTIKLLEAV